GPVSAGRPYLVGERGPELFVPSGFGRVEPRGPGTGTRDVRVSISINAAGQSAPAALQASSRQVARAVRRALIEE
ncbi:MAG: tail tape measure protein, partial [Blastomonas fulva]